MKRWRALVPVGVVLLAVLTMAEAGLVSAGNPPDSAGFLPRGTEIPELRTHEARHFSNGDGSIRAVIAASGPGPVTDNVEVELPAFYSGYVKSPTMQRYTTMLCGNWPGQEEERAFVEWNTSSIPLGSEVMGVRCSSYCYSTGEVPPTRVLLNDISNRPYLVPNDFSGNLQLFNDIGTGNTYGSYEAPAPPGWLAAELSGQARADLESRLGDGWFAVGYQHYYEGGAPRWEIGFRGYTHADKPQLVVDYITAGAPARPQPQQPSNGSTVEIFRPTLTVAAISGADLYNFRLYKQGNSTPDFDVQSSSNSWVPTVDLIHGQAYEWDCRAHNTVGWGAFFDPRWTFNVDIPLPPAPTCSLPPDGGTVATFTPTLSVRTVQYADQYHFEVWQGASFVEQAYVATNFWTMSVPLANGVTYTWRARARNFRGWGPSGADWTFTVRVPPGPPTPSAPANGSQVTTLQPQLQVDAFPGALKYHFRVWRGGTLAAQESLNNTVWAVNTALQNGTEHQWECRVQTVGGWGSYFTPRWTFTTYVLPPAPAPELPANGATVTTFRPTLQVAAVSGALEYRFRVYRQSGGALVTTGTTSSRAWTMNVDLPVDGEVYEWECQVRNAAGWGPYFSPQRNFTLVAQEPAAPIPNAPGNGATVSVYRPTLQVGWIADAQEYNFRVFEGGVPVYDASSVSRSWTVPANLENVTTYEWDCRARNAKGWGARFSPQWTFKVAVPPVAPTPVSPPNNSDVGTLTPTLTVSPVSDAVQYHFRVYEGATLRREVYTVGDETSVIVEPDLENGMTYSWVCRARNVVDWGANSVSWSFTPRVLPAVPVPLSPPDGATVMTGTPRLEVAAVPGADRYEFRVWSDGALVAEASDAGRTWTVSPCLAGGLTYEWECQAHNAAGQSGFFVPRRTFKVLEGMWPDGWHEVRAMPAGNLGKAVKDGGWLAVGPDKETGFGIRGSGFEPLNPRTLEPSNPVIYAAKGNKTTEFYKYDPLAGENGTWHELAPMPEMEDGKRKPPSKGTDAVSDEEGVVYMTRGNNMLGFYKYDVEQDTWLREEDVPLGDYKKKVKGGNDMVYVVHNDTGYVYLLKGQRTEFYRFNTTSGKWETREEVPFQAKQKYDKGSFLVYDGGNTIYAHQAKVNDGQNHYIFAFDLVSQTWNPTAKKGIPVVGIESGKLKKKKAGDGSAGAWFGGYLYALKGGNTEGFFKYDAVEDTWTQLDGVPQMGSTQKNKRVKSGGDLAVFDRNGFFALKGNKTLEMWRYVEPTVQVQGQAQARDGVAGDSRSQIADCRLQIAPNPLRSGWATLRFEGLGHDPKSQKDLGHVPRLTVTIFDVAGRSVFSTRSPGYLTTGSLPLDLRRLSAGVYLVRLDAGGFTQTQKLVIER